eukprot:gene21057-62903_t
MAAAGSAGGASALRAAPRRAPAALAALNRGAPNADPQLTVRAPAGSSPALWRTAAAAAAAGGVLGMEAHEGSLCRGGFRATADLQATTIVRDTRG